jgi:hypothetical protein
MHIRVDHAERKSEVQVEQVQKEYGGPQVSRARILTLLLDQGKPRCIPPKSLSFLFEIVFIILYACALSLYELYDTVAVLRFSFPIILVYPCCNSCRSLEMARRRHRCR